MKTILLLFFSTFVCSASNAQSNPTQAKDTAVKIIRICAPSRASILAAKPLVVVFSHKHTFIIDVANMSEINPRSIQSINVLKDSTAAKKYGTKAQGGVVEIYLNDEKYPDAYKLLTKQDSVKK